MRHHLDDIHFEEEEKGFDRRARRRDGDEEEEEEEQDGERAHRVMIDRERERPTL